MVPSYRIGLCLFLANASMLSLSAEPAAQEYAYSQIEQSSSCCSEAWMVDKGWTFDASFLYWNAASDGYDFVQSLNRTVQNNTVSAQLNGEALPFNTWDPGFQVGVGYIFPQREQWSTRVGWTYFHTNSRRTVFPLEVSTASLIPNIIPFVMGSAATEAKAHWQLNYNILDAELGKQFFVGRWFSFKPLIGLRGGWIWQNFHVDYAAIFRTTTAFFLDTSFNCRQHLGGVGPRIGSDLKWHATKNWSLLGNLSTSILWTSMHMTQNINGFTFPTATTFLANQAVENYTFTRLRTNLEAQLGMEWETFYNRDCFRFSVSTLYTFSYWFGLNRLVNEIVARPNDNLTPGAVTIFNSGDLQLQGLNVTFAFDF